MRPCCAGCNYMKNIMEYELFIDHLFKIYNHYISNNNIYVNGLSDPIIIENDEKLFDDNNEIDDSDSDEYNSDIDYFNELNNELEESETDN